MSSPPDTDRTIMMPPDPSVSGDVSGSRPVPPEQNVPQTVALPSGEYPPAEYSSPRTITLGEYNAQSGATPAPTGGRKPTSMIVALSLSVLVFSFTATIAFAVVWLVLT